METGVRGKGHRKSSEWLRVSLWYSSQMRPFKGSVSYTIQLGSVTETKGTLFDHIITLLQEEETLWKESVPLFRGIIGKGTRNSPFAFTSTQKSRDLSYKAFLQEENSWCAQLLPSKFLPFFFLPVPSIIAFIKQCRFSHFPHPPPFFRLSFPLTPSSPFLS